MLSGDPINPYAPATPTIEGESVGSDPTPSVTGTTPSLNRLILRWTIVCSIAAGPSFFIGYDVSKQRISAMSLGVILFIAIYVLVDLYTRRWQWRQNVIARRILIFCYATRIAISVIFPIGMMVDIFAGLVSVTIIGESSIVNHNDGGVALPMSFATTLMLTMVQGFVLNLVLAVWGLIAFLVVLAFKFVHHRFQMLRN